MPVRMSIRISVCMSMHIYAHACASPARTRFRTGMLRHAAFARVRVGVHECVLVPHLDVHAARILVFCSSVLGDVAGQYVWG